MRRWLLVAVALFAAAPALADDKLPPAPYAYRQLGDPVQEAKAKRLMETLRCLVCQSQSIADSDAPIAGDMRNQVRMRIAAGEDPEAIRAWLVARYGDYVSYSPRIDRVTWPLFALPALLLALAGLVLARRLQRGVWGMIWAMIGGLLVLVLAVLIFAFKAPRGSYEALGAALAMALAGYAWQGRPDLPAAPRTPDETISGRAAAEIDARQAMAKMQRPGMDGGNGAMITADALLRHAQFADAAGVLRVAVERNPNDSDAWLGMGNALMGHAQGRLTPAALLAYGRAMRADPAAPGPPYFLGLAYAEQGNFVAARKLWSTLMARTPANAPWRPALTAALARLDRITSAERAAGRPDL